MKIKLLVTLLLVVAISNAQNIKFGIKGGLNVSTISVSGNKSVDLKTSPAIGFLIGGVAEFKLNEKISIQPELLYSTHSGKQSYKDFFLGSIQTYDYTQTVTLSSISLPVMVKYNFTKNISIEAGPQIGYLLSARSNFTFVTANATISGNGDLSNSQTLVFSSQANKSVNLTHDYQLTKLSFGLNLGGTYSLDNGLFLQARYNLGLTSFSKNANVLSGKDDSGFVPEPRFNGTEMTNSNFQFTLGYNFN